MTPCTRWQVGQRRSSFREILLIRGLCERCHVVRTISEKQLVTWYGEEEAALGEEGRKRKGQRDFV
jgi:hypothetical protein